jgi:hypothetical protein
VYRWAEIARREPLWATTGGASAPRRPGRPAKLNPEVVGRFLMVIRMGKYRETAARFAGIGPAGRRGRRRANVAGVRLHTSGEASACDLGP